MMLAISICARLILPLSGATRDGHEQRSQDGDDSYDDQQLDERERAGNVE